MRLTDLRRATYAWFATSIVIGHAARDSFKQAFSLVLSVTRS